jgi:hypothetical protein
VRFDRALCLPAGAAHGRASTPSGGILALKPAVAFHALAVVETVVSLERHDRNLHLCLHLFEMVAAQAQCLFSMVSGS